jgi:hypothetical protein
LSFPVPRHPEEPVSDQLNLDGFWLCPRCNGDAVVVDQETGASRPCKVCEATGVVPYDPQDRSFGF